MSHYTDEDLRTRVLALLSEECAEYDLSPTNRDLCDEQMRKGLDSYGPRNHLRWSEAQKFDEVRQELADALNIVTALSRSREEEVPDELAWLIRSALELALELQLEANEG